MPPASTVNVADSSMSSRTEKRRKKAVVQLGKQCSPVLLHSREFSFGVANAAGISRERRAKQMTSARYTPQNGLAIPCFLIQLVALERSVSGSCQVRVVRQLFLAARGPARPWGGRGRGRCTGMGAGKPLEPPRRPGGRQVKTTKQHKTRVFCDCKKQAPFWFAAAKTAVLSFLACARCSRAGAITCARSSRARSF